MNRLLVAALIVVSGNLQAADQAPKLDLNPVALGVAVKLRRLITQPCDAIRPTLVFYNEKDAAGKKEIIEYIKAYADEHFKVEFLLALQLQKEKQDHALADGSQQAPQQPANGGLTALQLMQNQQREDKERAQKEKEKKADVAFQQQLLTQGQVTKDQQVAQQLQAEEKRSAARERERKNNAAQRQTSPQGQNGNGQMRVQQPTAPLRDFSLREEEQKAIFADQEREIAAALAGHSVETLIALANKYPGEVDRIDKRIGQLMKSRYPSEPSAPESPQQQVRPPDPQRNEILIGGGDELSQEELHAMQRNEGPNNSQADLEMQIAVAESSGDMDALLRLQRKYTHDATKLSIIQGAIDRLGKQWAGDAQPQNQADGPFRGEAFNLGNPRVNGAVYERDPGVRDARDASPDGAGPDDAKPDSLWKQIKKFVKEHPAETTAVGVVAAAGGALLYKNYKTKQ